MDINNPYENEDNQSYIVVSYTDMGNDIEDEVIGLQNAIELFKEKWSLYELYGGSFSSLMSAPILSHPDGSGLEWDLNKNNWV